MPKLIEFEGQLHEFPDDFTDDEIAEALSQVPPPATPAPQVPVPTQPAIDDAFWQVSRDRARQAKADDEWRARNGLPAPGSSSVPADQQGYAPLEATIQGVARSGADILGLPVDLVTAANNAARGALNLPGWAKSRYTGQRYKSAFDYITKPTGGSDWIADKASQAASAVGIDALDYDQMSARDKTAYQASRFATGGLVQGLGLRSLAAARAPSSKPRQLDDLFAPYVAETATPTIARDAAVGAGTGIGLAAADTMLPEDSRGPIASLIAGLAGGTAGGTIADALTVGPKATYAWATAGRPDREISFNADGSYVSRGASRDAARYLQDQAGGSAAAQTAADTIGRRAAEFETMGAPVPTTGQISGNVGLARVERGIRNTSEPSINPLFDRDREVNTFAGQQIRGMAPSDADPNLYPRAAQEVASNMRAPVTQEVEGAQRGLQGVQNQRLAEAQSLTEGAATRRTTSSQQLDAAITGDMAALRQQRSEALRSATIDPNNEIRLQASAIYDAADRALEAGVNLPDSLRKRVQVAAELAGRRPRTVEVTSPILDANGRPMTRAETTGSPDISLAELNEMRPVLAQLSSAYEKAIGNGNTAAIPQREAVDTLRREINNQLRAYAESGETPQAERLAKGLELGDEFKARYSDPGPGDPVVELYRDMRKERGDLTGRTMTPPEQTADRFIKPPERGGIQGMRSLNRLMETATDPAAISSARREFLLAVAASRIVENGRINPKRIGRFIDEWGPVLEAAPETRAAFGDLLSKAQRGEALETDLARAIEGAQARLKMTSEEIADSALATVMGATGRRGVQAIIASRNPPAQMADLMQRIERVPGGTDSVRRALADYLADRVTNTNRQATADGGLPPSYAKLIGLEKDPDLDRVIAAAWKDDPSAMQALQRARRVLEPREFLATVQGTAGSPSASNIAAAMRVLELGLRTMQGGFRGGNTARNIKVGLGMLLRGRENEVLNLVARSHVDPALARLLLSKELGSDPAAWSSKMRKILNWEEAARQTNEEE